MSLLAVKGGFLALIMLVIIAHIRMQAHYDPTPALTLPSNAPIILKDAVEEFLYDRRLQDVMTALFLLPWAAVTCARGRGRFLHQCTQYMDPVLCDCLTTLSVHGNPSVCLVYP